MKSFIRIKLNESLNNYVNNSIDLSKIEISMDIINGLLVFLPFYGDERMGSFRLKQVEDGFKIESTLIYDRFKNKRVGSYMYQQIIAALKNENYKLYSDDNQTEDAKHVWDSLVSKGLATKDGNQYSSL